MKRRLCSMLLVLAMLAALIVPASAAYTLGDNVVSGTVIAGTSNKLTAQVTASAEVNTAIHFYVIDMEDEGFGDYTTADTTAEDVLDAWLTAKNPSNYTDCANQLDYALLEDITLNFGAAVDGTYTATQEFTFGNSGFDYVAGTTYGYIVWGDSRACADFGSFKAGPNNTLAVEYTVTYDKNGGSTEPDPASAKVDGGNAVTLPAAPGTKTDNQFRGWGTSSDNGATITKVGGAGDTYKPTANVTLYAIWKADATLVYNLNDNGAGATGAPTDAGSRAADDEVTLSTTAPTWTGYTFKGWGPANNSAATDKITSKTLAAGTNTVYAIWEAIPVTLTGSNITAKTNNALDVTLPTAGGGSGDGFNYTTSVTGDLTSLGLTLSTDGDTPNTLTGTPTAEGEATISYTATDKTTGATKTIQIKVTVSDKDPASILGVPTSTVEGKVGGGVTPVITTNSTSPLTFKSSDEAVVTVDANGKLTFVAEGEAVITVSVAEDATYAEASKTYNVKVGPAVTAEPHDAFMFGYEGTKSFGPDDQLTRAQAVTILARLDGWKDGQEVKVDEMFPDVKNIWYYNAIAYAKKAGIVEGFEDGTFQPDKPITRAEFSKMLARMANEGKDPTGTSSALSDAKEHWANVWIGYLETSFPGSIGGREDGLFHPNDDITRAETAKIVNGYLGRLQSVSAKEADQLAADLNKFDDVKRCTWYYNNVMEATVNHESTTEKFHTAD